MAIIAAAVVVVYPVAGVVLALVFAVFLILGVLAPQMPFLHRVPIVGAARVDLDIHHVEHARVSPGKMMLSFGVTSSARLEDGRVSLLVPVDVPYYITNAEGQRAKTGNLLLPTSEPVDPACELAKPWTLRIDIGQNTEGYFVVSLEGIDRPRFRVRAKVGSDRIYKKEYQRDFDIEVKRPSGYGDEPESGREFPDLVIVAKNPMWIGPEESKSFSNEQESLIVVPIRVTNREPQRNANLTFSLAADVDKPFPRRQGLSRARMADKLGLPETFKVACEDTGEGDLWFTWSHAFDFVYGPEATERDVVDKIFPRLKLTVTDYLSDKTVELDVPGTWSR